MLYVHLSPLLTGGSGSRRKKTYRHEFNPKRTFPVLHSVVVVELMHFCSWVYVKRFEIDWNLHGLDIHDWPGPGETPPGFIYIDFVDVMAFILVDRCLLSFSSNNYIEMRISNWIFCLSQFWSLSFPVWLMAHACLVRRCLVCWNLLHMFWVTIIRLQVGSWNQVYVQHQTWTQMAELASIRPSGLFARIGSHFNESWFIRKLSLCLFNYCCKSGSAQFIAKYSWFVLH